MDFTAYQRQAKKTAIYKRRMTYAYLIPGAADEAFEVMDAQPESPDELEDAGDALWMSVMLRAELGLSLCIVPFAGGCHIKDHLEEPARALVHRWTKIARDRHGIPNEDDIALIDSSTTKIIRLIMALVEKRGTTTEALVSANLDKLEGRKQRSTLAGSGTR